MKSQVSFTYSGCHNTPFIKDILNNELKDMVCRVHEISYNIYRIYVASKDEALKVFQVCHGIQCFCVYDDTLEF